MSKPSKNSEMLAKALDLHLKGDTARGLLLLKQVGMGLREAREALAEAAAAPTPPVPTEADLQHAAETVEVFDDLTLTVLRFLRDHKVPVASHGPTSLDDLTMSSLNIFLGMRSLISHGINPTRAMEALLSVLEDEVCDRATGELPNSVDIPGLVADPAVQEKMKVALHPSLQDDLLSLV